MNLAPIALFTFKRLDTLKHTINSLQKNIDACNTELYIFSDAGRNEKESFMVNEVREYIYQIKGFKKINIIESLTNKGLANSIISGVTAILEYEKYVIVLEDDLILSVNFISFMNQSLKYFSDNKQIVSIAGYSPPITIPSYYLFNGYFAKRSTSWGWATWNDRWENVNWNVEEYPKTSFSTGVKLFLLGANLPSMLRRQKNGKIDSWAIRFVFNQFLNNQLTYYPTITKVMNIGFDENSTHTTKTFKTNTDLDASLNDVFSFPKDVKLNNEIVKSFSFHYGLISKILSKLKILS